jgi:hypothetical protein
MYRRKESSTAHAENLSLSHAVAVVAAVDKKVNLNRCEIPS